MERQQTPQILITPLKPALIAGMSQKLPVLVRVQAPDPDLALQKSRKPYHLALVIDRSGSMSGEPLIEALRCARYIVDQLTATDVVSLTVFDDRVNTLVNAQAVGDRKVLHQALAHIQSGGSTNLQGGWLAGSNSLLSNAKAAALARVILLSDGNANVGVTTDTKVIAALCAEAAERGVTTSTYGLGRDFNEDLMVEMGERGGGNHYYGDTAADLFEPFAEEFDFISNLYARQMRLALAAPAGVNITLLNDYPVEQREGFPLILMPDLALGAEAWALVELEIPANMASETAVTLLQAGITATTPDCLPITVADAALALSAMSAQAWEMLIKDPLVLARQAEIEAAQWLERARLLAQAGDLAGIEKMIAEGRVRFAEHAWVIEVLESLEQLAKEMDYIRFSKEALYSSKKMRKRLAAKEEAFDTLNEDEMALYLRRKRSQGKSQFEP